MWLCWSHPGWFPVQRGQPLSSGPDIIVSFSYIIPAGKHEDNLNTDYAPAATVLTRTVWIPVWNNITNRNPLKHYCNSPWASVCQSLYFLTAKWIKNQLQPADVPFLIHSKCHYLLRYFKIAYGEFETSREQYSASNPEVSLSALFLLQVLAEVICMFAGRVCTFSRLRGASVVLQRNFFIQRLKSASVKSAGFHSWALFLSPSKLLLEWLFKSCSW